MASDLNQPQPNGLYGSIGWYNGIRIKEIAGRTGTTTAGTKTGKRVFSVLGTIDPAAAQKALEDGPVPINEHDGMFINAISYAEGASEKEWRLTVGYDARIPEVGGTPTISIDSTGGQVLQTYAYNETRFPANGETAPNYNGAIDVQDGAPQGVERIIPVLKINVRAKIARSWVTSPEAYTRIVTGLTGTYNHATFLSYPAGELLFAGATGDVVSDADPLLTYTFLASSNVTGLTIGDIAGIAKKGHDYLWFAYKQVKDQASGLVVSKPRAAYVNQIYGPGDMSLMKIGQS